MRVLTIDECTAWLAARGLTLEPAPQPGWDHHVRIPEGRHGDWVGTPQDARTVASLAFLLAQVFPCSGSLLVVTVVTSFQNYEIDAFLWLRRSQGDDRWVDGVPGGATPGHIFDAGGSGDERDVRDLLASLMAYTFEGTLVSADGTIILAVLDDVIEWRCADAQAASKFQAIATDLSLTQTDWGRALKARPRTTR